MTPSKPRPILKLKNPPKLAPAPPAPPSWKCKPCGELFSPAACADEHKDVRCPRCNARLGPLDDFMAKPPRAEKLRARHVGAPPPAAPKRQTRSG